MAAPAFTTSSLMKLDLVPSLKDLAVARTCKAVSTGFSFGGLMASGIFSLLLVGSTPAVPSAGSAFRTAFHASSIRDRRREAALDGPRMRSSVPPTTFKSSSASFGELGLLAGEAILSGADSLLLKSADRRACGLCGRPGSAAGGVGGSSAPSLLKFLRRGSSFRKTCQKEPRLPDFFFIASGEGPSLAARPSSGSRFAGLRFWISFATS
mmetsp:Transcript_5107/g.20419  ORF Transcript_5107/g.20419 Transcript_5107/m.20419 type:complete len:210 (+) Transcript_5107:201-830(+)